MRAIEVREFGRPEVLVAREVADPVAGPGQVVVNVAAADTLWIETAIRSGLASEWFDTKPPYLPGGGVSGQVTSVGDGVDPAWLGRRVAASVDDGGYAEQALVDAENLIAVPDGLGLPEAAALLSDGTTALAVFEPAEVKPGEKVLITGAAGGMGTLLIQLAHAAGALVIAAARGEEKLDLARKLGADVTIDYTQPDWTAQVRKATNGTGADVVFDGAGGPFGTAAFAVTADGGRFSAHGAPAGGFAQIDPAEATRRGVTVRGIQDVQLTPAERTQYATRAINTAATGAIAPVIGRTFDLANAADAHAAIESRTVLGKALLVTG